VLLPASFSRGVAVDTAGNVYVPDNGNSLIRMISPAGVVTTLAGTVGAPGSTNANGTAASFKYPQGVAVDTAGNVYVADTSNHLIRMIISAA
jgi:serine/threonine protein kinase, bacterial